MNVGILIAYGKSENKEALAEYAIQLIADVQQELEESTGIPWVFDVTDANRLENDGARSPRIFWTVPPRPWLRDLMIWLPY